MHTIIDNTGTTQYIDSAWFWVYGNRERKRLNIIKGLIQVVNDLISLDELNLLAVTYKPNHFWKNNNGPVEIQNNNKKSNETITVSVEEEQK